MMYFLKNVFFLFFKEAKVAVPDNVLDRANKLEPSYTDRKKR